MSIYIYNTIDETLAERVNKEIDNSKGDIDIRLATGGGYTSYGVSMLTKLESYEGKVNMFVDGDTYSMGAFMLLFADNIEMSSMAEVMFHKAAYPQWYTPTEADIKNLDRENERFKSKMQERFGIKGQEFINRVFAEGREDVYLTAKEAYDIGLVNKIIELSVKQKAALIEKSKTNTNTNINNSKMDITKEQIEKQIKEAYEKGRNDEKERVKTWMVFDSVDKEAVKKAISEGSEMTESERTRLLFESTKQNSKNDDLKPLEKAEIKTEQEIKKTAKSETISKIEEMLNIKL